MSRLTVEFPVGQSHCMARLRLKVFFSRAVLVAAFVLLALAHSVTVADDTQPARPRHNLESGLWPRALSGGEYAAIADDSHIYLVHLKTGEKKQVGDVGSRKREVVLSPRFVAWTAEPSEGPVLKPSRGESRGVQIFVYDRENGSTRQITETPAPRSGLSIDGDWLVWADKRNELDAYYMDTDIYGFDLARGVERPIAIAPGAQRNPTVRGSRVVWDDNRKNPDRAKPSAGCDNCAENRRDIYLYDLATGKERPLAEDEWLKAHPVIEGNLVAWEAYRGLFDSRITVLDLTTGTNRQVSMEGMAATLPRLSGERLLWVVRSDCDVFPRRPNTGVYLQNLRTSSGEKLTDYVEPSALLDGQTVLVTERCQIGGRAYAVHLD